MDQRTTVGDVVSWLRRDIAERTGLLRWLEEFAVEAQPPRGARRTNAASAAVEMLRSADRPMHALDELIPALEAEGHRFSRAAFPASLLRTGKVVRTAPGTFAYRASENTA